MPELETSTTDPRWGGEGRDLKAKQIMQTLRHFAGRDLSAALWLDFSCSSGGIAYFAGPNLLFPIEPHVFWPFVHWLPRGLAVRLMRALGSRKVLDANSASWWRLHAWFDGFEVSNALPYFMLTHWLRDAKDGVSNHCTPSRAGCSTD